MRGAALFALVAARRRRLAPAAIATALQMSLVYWEQMVRYLEREGPDAATRQ
ncbi:MAG: hypothetical protein VYA67_00385 [Actinomycetota bacterium]|uniref:TetR family transcriptional regulator n=1 Tax=Mycobacterium lentiflavum TaxID=141349 RepID=A0ABY3V6Y9_MYCLN|nr:hypothetical protein [Mycobacterium lentiflavum]MEE3062410.1 hypothetical protein [Actinomycetota bacterium]ULP45395.1 hypothetical protein MJO58_12315 [Mycobacterium lentiflavum]